MRNVVRVRTESVRPLEIAGRRANPRDLSTPEKREFVARLAEQFRRNRLNPGEPHIPPILYREGDGYRIVDGECRFTAMKAIGTEEFWAEVYDDLDDAEAARIEAAKAMVETDAKLPLTPAEMGLGVQGMLELGIPDEEVAAAAGIDAAKVARVRRGARRAAGAARTMSIDHLLAVEDFADDERAAERLRNCGEDEWRAVYRRLTLARERAQAAERVRSLLAEAGVAAVEDREGYRTGRELDAAGEDTEEEVRRWIERTGDVAGRAACVRAGKVSLLVPGTDGTSEEERDKRRQRLLRRDALANALAARNRWMSLSYPSSCPHVDAFLARAEFPESAWERPFRQATGKPARLEAGPVLTAARWPLAWSVGETDADLLAEGGGEWPDWKLAELRRSVGLLEAMAQDGYEPCDVERLLMERATQVLAG